ncbi:MAG: DUF6702 family protein [Pseudomonadota bacterium]
MIRALAMLLAALLTLPFAASVAAHQQKVTISTLEHNPRTGMLEVVHLIPLHDAEHALRSQGISAPDIVSDVESRRAFARYVAARFNVEANGEPVELIVLGTDTEGGRLLVYQEARSPGVGSELLVHAQILTDVWARQENRVNLGTGTSVETLIFTSGDRPKEGLLP